MTRPAMFVAFASRLVLAASLLCLSALADAQPTPAATASDATHGQVACEKTSFDGKGGIVAPAGAIVPPQGAVVRALLQFDDPRAEPAVTVTFNSGNQAFADAVVAEAKTYRFDCVKTGDAPLRFTQEVQFVGGDAPKVVLGSIRPVAQRQDLECFTSADGNPRVPITFKWDAMITGSNVRRQDLQLQPRIIIVAMTFSAPDVPPEASILFSRAEGSFEGAVLDYVAGHRWACMKKGDPPVRTVQTFRYLFEDHAPAPAEFTLQQFLGAIDKITEQKVRFDFTTMGCPFKFSLNYVQPFMPNGVQEIGGSDPNRREFVHWLHGVTVKPALNPDNKLVDREIEVSVPCLILDLT